MREIDILTSMSGISVVTAIALVADVITVTRFRNAKHFASYLRSVPRVESSNDKTIIKSTTKAGRKLSITLLSQSLNHFRDENKKLQRWYEKVEIFKKKGEYHYFRNPRLHEKKMAEYQKFLEKRGINFEENLKLSA
jgi:Mn-containing catalase